MSFYVIPDTHILEANSDEPLWHMGLCNVKCRLWVPRQQFIIISRAEKLNTKKTWKVSCKISEVPAKLRHSDFRTLFSRLPAASSLVVYTGHTLSPPQATFFTTACLLVTAVVM